ncbi:hypothetical protein S7711_02198 [Stachybotrys chartarum IBT 7711]|uniref:Cytoskeleton-associated protein n=1 Tax=Stachybotrys chartarum (strain CBS 109288 / IBT 7711) TaxID=1280523 RepID=A0A084AZ65_STACB|nr:hypothetical protein S7711_02198 [Stachybotrys chartarum IBT 7711]KFA54903.1 hypothetical protein S40293_08554 [Stachybotrys chartarum IBT 40293]KFA76600.1 hypothetical protein S40288_08125 [Stachybotrys chartarum IBT 40288]
MGWQDGLVALVSDQRVVGVALGLCTISIVATMISTLSLMRDDSVITPPEPKTQYITQETEDSLRLETLDTLLSHTNYSIKDIAVKILCDRAINDPDAVKILLYGITRPDYDERMKCLRALALLTGQTLGLDGLSTLNNAPAYSALVRSLELSLGDNPLPKVDDIHWDEYYVRDMAERFCLMFVLELITKYEAEMLVKAQFVEKWLSKQDWGNTAQERQETFDKYMSNKRNRIVDIVKQIKKSQRGLRALEEAELITDVEFKWHTYLASSRLRGSEGEGNQAQAGDAADGTQVTRAMEHSAEEQRLRRQHREAMVLNDGSRPFGREDIIEREHSFSN